MSGNQATSTGGIYNAAGVVTLTNSVVDGNVAISFGGGIFNDYGTVSIIGSTISNNVAGENGGGIWSSGVGNLIVTDSTVSGNDAGVGGGIGHTTGMTVTGSTIIDNSASESGGGIYSHGIHSSEDAPVSISDSTVSGNESVLGGGIYFDGNDGGTIFGFESQLTLVDTAVISNEAASGGGVSFDGELVITRGAVSYNVAEEGGGIYGRSEIASATLTDVEVAGNTASGDGAPSTTGSVAR